MTKDEVFEELRGEREKISEVDLDKELLLPITRDGFEALLERAANIYNLPVDDGMRLVVAGFVHHIPNESCIMTIQPIADVMYKSMANTLTWKIDQEIKEKRNAEAEKLKAEEAKKIAPEEKL